jgi:hypothetical protein
MPQAAAVSLIGVKGPLLAANHRGPDHDHAHQERQQRRKHQIVDRRRQAGGQHADEMHRPDRDRK